MDEETREIFQNFTEAAVCALRADPVYRQLWEASVRSVLGGSCEVAQAAGEVFRAGYSIQIAPQASITFSPKGQPEETIPEPFSDEKFMRELKISFLPDKERDAQEERGPHA